MITCTIDTLGEYERMFGTSEFTSAQFDLLLSYYEDDEYSTSEEGRLEDNWTAYDSLEEACEHYCPDKLESIKEDTEVDEDGFIVWEDEYNGALLDALEYEVAVVLTNDDYSIVLVKD